MLATTCHCLQVLPVGGRNQLPRCFDSAEELEGTSLPGKVLEYLKVQIEEGFKCRGAFRPRGFSLDSHIISKVSCKHLPWLQLRSEVIATTSMDADAV